MTELQLYESDAPRELELEDSIVASLVAVNAITANPLGPSRWEVSAGQKVGVVRCGDLTVWIKPKVSISRLLWLMGWSRRDVFVSPGPVSLEEEAEVVPAIAEAFCSLAENALSKGLLQGYRSVESTDTVLRGRLRTDDQLRHRFGIPVPLLLRYDDYLTDIAENQILKAATSRLLLVPALRTNVVTRLRGLRGILSGISDLPRGAAIPRWMPNRLNARYADALWLAQVVLAAGSVEQSPGSVRLDGFLLDVYKIYEDFVTSTLGRALEEVGGDCTAQDTSTLDEEADIPIRPDLVWRVDGAPAAVIDAKYKAEKPSGFAQADLYQALAYAISYGLDRAHLIYAKGNEPARTWTVRRARVQITAHTLDLMQTPQAILTQIGELACRIASELSSTAEVRSSQLTG